MKVRLLLLATMLSVPVSAFAGWHLGGGVEYFQWTEEPNNIVKETGPMLQVNGGFTQDKDSGPLFAYRGRVYGGEVDYDGALLFDTSTRVKGEVQYSGTSHEAQLRLRIANSWSNGLDFVLGGGFDTWERRLSSSQKEQYFIGFARLGIDVDQKDRGWLFGLGLKYPFYTYERAYLSGMDPNPLILRPGQKISPYGQLGYQFNKNWRLVGYFDSFHFSESDPERAFVPGQGTSFFVQPESRLYRGGIRFEWVFN